MKHEQQQEQEAPWWVQAVLVAGTLAANLVIVWASLPPQERLWIRLRLTGVLREAADVRARQAGRAGMRDELAGRDPGFWYGTALRLSRWRDGLARSLEAIR